jgi:hypothetical protein
MGSGRSGLIPAAIAGARAGDLRSDGNTPHLFLQWFNTSCYQATPTINAGIVNVPGNGSRRDRWTTDQTVRLLAVQKHPDRQL